MAWSEADLAKYLERTGVPGQPNTANVSKPPFRAPGRPMYALGRLKTGEMNKTEAAYAEHLKHLEHRGDILWWKFEGMKFRLADLTFYTPDFNIMKADGHLVHHEIKGFFQEDAKVKIKVVASMYPFEFVVVRKGKQGIWNLQPV